MGIRINWDSEELHHKLYLLAREGCTITEIAKKLGCGLSTLKRKRDQIEPVWMAIKKGQELSTGNNCYDFENSLKKICNGFDHEEKKIVRKRMGTKKQLEDDKTAIFEETITIIKKHTGPNVTALIFWLKNNMPQFYKTEVALAEKAQKEDDNLKDKGTIIDFLKAMKEEGEKISKQEE